VPFSVLAKQTQIFIQVSPHSGAYVIKICERLSEFNYHELSAMALASRASCSVADTICPRPLQVVTCRPSRSWLNFGHGIKRPGDLDL